MQSKEINPSSIVVSSDSSQEDTDTSVQESSNGEDTVVDHHQDSDPPSDPVSGVEREGKLCNSCIQILNGVSDSYPSYPTTMYLSSSLGSISEFTLTLVEVQG